MGCNKSKFLKSLRILHLTIDSRYGGIYRFIELWSKLDLEANPYILHSTFKYNYLESSINIINKRLSNKREKKGIYFIFDFIVNIRFYLYEGLKNDVIVIHSIYLVFLIPLFKILRKDIYIISHDFNNPILLQIISYYLIKRKHIFVAPWLKKSFWRSTKDSLNICLPTNLIIKTELTSVHLGKRIFPEPYQLSFVYIGSLSDVKGFNDLIILLNQIEKNVLINIIGPAEERYLKRLSKINNNHKLIFHGGIYDENRKKRIISSANFAIIPSRSEVFPFVYSEFLNEGLIPICNSINVFKELSTVQLHLYDSKNINEFKDCIQWSISLTNKDYLSYHRKLVENFNQFIMEHKNINSLSMRIINGYF